MLGQPLHERFNLIFGTSTGAIIAALLALGHSVDEVHDLYGKHVLLVMGCRTRAGRSAALAQLARDFFEDKTFADVKTGIGVVATRWEFEKPMIFKGDVSPAHGRREGRVNRTSVTRPSRRARRQGTTIRPQIESLPTAQT